jgi:hypothetical protein
MRVEDDMVIGKGAVHKAGWKVPQGTMMRIAALVCLLSLALGITGVALPEWRRAYFQGCDIRAAEGFDDWFELQPGAWPCDWRFHPKGARNVTIPEVTELGLFTIHFPVSQFLVRVTPGTFSVFDTSLDLDGDGNVDQDEHIIREASIIALSILCGGIVTSIGTLMSFFRYVKWSGLCMFLSGVIHLLGVLMYYMYVYVIDEVDVEPPNRLFHQASSNGVSPFLVIAAGALNVAMGVALGFITLSTYVYNLRLGRRGTFQLEEL